MASFIGNLIGGSFVKDPTNVREHLSEGSLKLLDSCFEGLPGPVEDVHTHIGGNGSGNTGCKVHPNTKHPLAHPILYITFKAMLSASNVKNENNADEEFVERLAELIGNAQKEFNWGKHFVLAFDQTYNADGSLNEYNTGMYIPNDYIWKVYEKYPNLVSPTMSVHPYRKDALEELTKWGERGIKMIKWLPNSQGIHPENPHIDEYYQVMKKYNMVLLSHTGDEHSIDPPGLDNGRGNPLHLRRPLDLGVKVIAAHCASEGKSKDFENPGNNYVSNFKLFMRLMDDPKYKDLLYADISAVTAFMRIGEPLTTIIDRDDLHHRLVYGSDYPVPALKFVVSTRSLQRHGYITEAERHHLNEIYEYNPLLFDFACKRVLRSPTTGKKFSPSIFTHNSLLFD